MNDAIKAQISAYVDGELPDNEAELLVRRMSQDKVMRDQAAEYLAISRAMRGERRVPGMKHLRDRVAAQLDDRSVQVDEEPPATGRRFLRPVAGAAIAATVALAALLGLQQVAEIQELESATAVETVASDQPYTVPAQDDNQLREYYLRHSRSSSHIGADRINARLVTLELRDGVLVEADASTGGDADKPDDGLADPAEEAP
jgi:sigma-E factor negative regulatory protein RseA